MVSGYFAIDTSIREPDHIDARVIFKAFGKTNEQDISDSLTESLRQVLRPDVVLFICCPSEVENFATIFDRDQVQQALLRAEGRCSVVIGELTSAGTLSKIIPVYPETFSKTELCGLILAKAYSAGLSKLFDPKTVLVTAPAGYQFLKTSQNRSPYFLKAENALYQSEAVHFIACSLLPKILRREENTRQIEVIFVDTMAISSLAFTIRELYDEFYKPDSKPRIQSFHSYSGMQDINFPLPGTSLCLISASSSMNMHREWLKLSRCSASEVVTLITLKDAEGRENALHQLDKTREELNSETEDSFRDIRIVGEMFSQETIEPREVVLKNPTHFQRELANKIVTLSDDNVFGAFLSGGKLVHADGLKLNRCLKTEFEEYVASRVPISVSLIIHQNDSSSENLAVICKKVISEATGNELRIVNATELPEVDIDKSSSILVVASVVGRGDSLLSISRELRNRNEGTRRYLVGLQVAEHYEDVTRLKKNLQYPKDKNEVHTLLALAVGQHIKMTYTQEAELLKELPLELPPAVSSRNEGILGTNTSLSDKFVFLPKAADGLPMALRAGFALWNQQYDVAKNHQAAVLATVAATLQFARESDQLAHADQLGTPVFQQVVISPENFARFNDGVIQAALLRAAMPWELDYSTMLKASREVANMLGAWLVHFDREQGEASLEFALALAIGKLKLKRDTHEELVGKVIDEIAEDNPYGALICELLRRSLNPPNPSI